jgi:hypothetical protein
LPASRVLAALAAAACALVACATSSTTLPVFPPITGIVIRSSSLVAGIGCGTGDDQVYRYAAVVTFAPTEGGTPSTTSFTNIFDCFTDGVFENLPADNGNLNFDVSIYAYNFKDYGPATAAAPMGAGLPPDLACPPGNDATGCVPATTPLTDDQKKDATWTTLCTATQQAGVPVLAVCPLLVATGDGDAATTPVDASSEASDGGEAGPRAPDAGADGAADAGMDASDATDQTDAPANAADAAADAADLADVTKPD